MNESRPSSSEILGPRPLLRDVLVEATFKPGRAISSAIEGIDLGVFSDEARQLANSCFLDPHNSDMGKPVYVTGKKKVLVSNHYFRALNGGILNMISFIPNVQKEVAEKNGLDEWYLAMFIHTSTNTDLSFSPTDLFGLMLSDSNSASIAASFIAGKTKNTLAFRGTDAPQLSVEEAEKKAKFWEWQLDERVKGFIKPSMGIEEKIDIASRAEKTLLRQICQKYNLIFFSGDTNNNFVTRQIP